MIKPRPGNGRHPNHVLRVVAKVSNPILEGIAQASRQGEPCQPGLSGGHELLGKKRIATGSRHHRLNQLGRSSIARDAGKLLSEVVGVEGAKLDATNVLEPPKPGEQRPQRMAAMHLIGSVGHDEQEARIPGVPNEEPE